LLESYLNPFLESSLMMKPEDEARQIIDNLLESAGWKLQDIRELNLGASLGVAVRYFPLKGGEADYLLFVNRKAVGVVEAKPLGTTLSGVAEQSEKYLASLPDNLPHVQLPLPFAYESTGMETFFRDSRDPFPRSRRVFAFHKPETLAEWLSQENTLRARLMEMPTLITEGLRECQIEAITKLERSLANAKPRALIQMASGSGKTYTAVYSVYRLIKSARARRVLFLVDRNTLGRQTSGEFKQFTPPDSLRKFTEEFNVQHMTKNALDTVSRVCITTIQRLYSMLRGEPDFDPDLEEQSLFELSLMRELPREVSYNPQIPIETFDFIITDECHRSIYNLWRQVLEYFDAFIIGLTATPSKQTLGFFNQNLVMEYPHERAVADGVNVDYEVYRIRTEITERGSRVDAGYYVDKRDKLTRQVRWEQLDDTLEYSGERLDRDVVAPDQIRTVIRTFRDKLFTEIFPGRTIVPKTLIFAKDDSHAEDIVHIVREEFGMGNEFCKKITYRTTGEKKEDLITSLRNSFYPRIAVTVDMISTGTDVRPLECLLFMRDVKSLNYFDQMKGRGTRVVSPTELIAVSPDAVHKTHFMIVDAVGVCESDKTETRPLERQRSITFEKLITSVALGVRDDDTLSSLAGRLARLDKEIDEKDEEQIQSVSGGMSLRDIVNNLLDALDPDKRSEKAEAVFNTKLPTEEQLKKATEQLVETACEVFDNPTLRNLLIELKKKSEQTIDTISQDSVILAGFDEQAKEKAKALVRSFEQFIQDHKDEITAFQVLYSRPYHKRLRYDDIKELAETIKAPPRNWTPEVLWRAYELLEKDKVRGASSGRLLTDIVSLVRFATHQENELVPFEEKVKERFEYWMAQQEHAGTNFTTEQREWLRLMCSHIAASVSMEMDDFDYSPFAQKGGIGRAYRVFGENLEVLIDELNEVLAA